MTKELKSLENNWINQKIALGKPVVNHNLILFHNKTGLQIPKDLRDYFVTLNGMNDEYDEGLFRFYSFKEFESIDNGLKHWNGTPDYSKLVFTLEGYQRCYVFADYMFHMFTYCIRLSEEDGQKNEVYVLCGDKYKVIAHSFSAFINLYLTKSQELFL